MNLKSVLADAILLINRVQKASFANIKSNKVARANREQYLYNQILLDYLEIRATIIEVEIKEEKVNSLFIEGCNSMCNKKVESMLTIAKTFLLVVKVEENIKLNFTNSFATICDYII